MTGKELFDLYNASLKYLGIEPLSPTWETAPENLRHYLDTRARQMVRNHGEARCRESLDQQWASIGGRVAA